METGAAGLRAQLQDALGVTYTLERELGGGGMSRVFVAHDPRLGRRVVVKVLHPDLAAGLSALRFEREIAVAARLQHPHVVPLHTAGEVAGLPYYTMPFVEGESLGQRLAREGRLPIPDAVRLLRELADALTYAHGRGVVHRDLKPENVLLSGGHAVVADFGVARALASATQGGPTPGGAADGAAPEATQTTAVGIAVGTPAYMAPEQALGDPAADHRVDLYALGVIAYELLAGVPPFTGRTPQQFIAAHVTETPRPLAEHRADVPPALAALVAQLLAKAPQDRPHTAGDVMRALDAAGVGVTPSAELHALGRGADASWGRRFSGRPAVLGAAALVLLLAAAGGLYLERRVRDVRDGAAPAQSAASAPTRLAVLPFENLGLESDAYFALGLTDAIRGQLATLASLAVIDARSTAEYRKPGRSLREIGRELGVSYVLQGTVQWARGADGVRRLQVRPALVRVSDATTTWTAPYTAEAADVFQVQGDVAARVAVALDVALDAGQQRALARAPTRHAGAYDQYLRGLALEQRTMFGLNSWAAVVDAYARAVALDPRFGVAWARLAGARAEAWVAEGQSDPTHLALVRAALDSARRLAPATAETHVAAAHVAAAVERDFVLAVAEQRAALRLRPSDATLLAELGWRLADLQAGKGASLDEALDFLARAAALDPRQPPRIQAALFADAGRYREAIRYADRVIALAPGEMTGYRMKAFSLVFGWGDVAAARVVLDSASASVPERTLMRDLVVNWPNDAAAVFGEPYERRLESLSLTDFAPPVTRMDSGGFYLVKGQHALHTGRRELAAAYCDSTAAVFAPWDGAASEASSQSGDNVTIPRMFLAMAHACRGRRADAERHSRALSALLARPHSGWERRTIRFTLAMVGVLLGDRDSAVVHLEHAVRPPANPSAHWLRLDPLFAPLRGHPRFEALLTRSSP